MAEHLWSLITAERNIMTKAKQFQTVDEQVWIDSSQHFLSVSPFKCHIRFSDRKTLRGNMAQLSASEPPWRCDSNTQHHHSCLSQFLPVRKVRCVNLHTRYYYVQPLTELPFLSVIFVTFATHLHGSSLPLRGLMLNCICNCRILRLLASSLSLGV